MTLQGPYLCMHNLIRGRLITVCIMSFSTLSAEAEPVPSNTFKKDTDKIQGCVLKVHERLVAMGSYKPIPGNQAGSYLTAFSLQGFYSNINGIIVGLVQIFADQSYWQSAVAASPVHAVKVYCAVLHAAEIHRVVLHAVEIHCVVLHVVDTHCVVLHAVNVLQ